MNPIEITSRTTAIAEPKPIRLASPTMFCGDQHRQQFQAVPALVDGVDDVERAQRLDDRDDQDDDVDRPQRREHHPEERLRLVGAVDRGGLLQRGVHRLEPREIDDHHVADVPPGRRDHDDPDVDRGSPSQSVIPSPVTRVEHAVVAGVDELGDEADHRQRQHHRQVERALVEAGEPDAPVEQHRAEQPERRRDQAEEGQPEHVVADRGPERRIGGGEVVVVLGADPAGSSAMPFQSVPDSTIEASVGPR